MSSQAVSTFENGIPSIETVGAVKDHALADAAKNGSSHAFDALVERYKRRIFATAFRLTRNREDAEDIVQQTFQKAFVNLDRFEGRSSFGTWLTRIALNEAFMLLRSGRRSREVSLDETGVADGVEFVRQIPEPAMNPEQTYSQRERRRLLSLALGELKPEIRKAVELCGLQELSVKKTAQIMGVSVTAAKSRVLRGRRRLRQTLGHYVKSGHWNSGRVVRRRALTM